MMQETKELLHLNFATLLRKYGLERQGDVSPGSLKITQAYTSTYFYTVELLHSIFLHLDTELSHIQAVRDYYYNDM